MNWFVPLFGIAIALSSQCASAKNRLTDPVKIARECKSLENARARWSFSVREFVPVRSAANRESRLTASLSPYRNGDTGEVDREPCTKLRATKHQDDPFRVS